MEGSKKDSEVLDNMGKGRVMDTAYHGGFGRRVVDPGGATVRSVGGFRQRFSSLRCGSTAVPISNET